MRSWINGKIIWILSEVCRRVCEEISVNNQIFYDNELAEGLFKSFPPCFIYSSERIVCQEHRLFLGCGSIKQIPIPGAAPHT